MKIPVIARCSAALFALSFYPALSGTEATTPATREHIVEIRHFKFQPETLHVMIGDTITWINRDIVPHTATSSDGSWDTGTLDKDEARTLTVSSTMALDYICRFHVNMTGAIVTQNRAATTPRPHAYDTNDEN